MDLLHQAQCQSRLNFKPLRVWPQSLPAIAWNKHIIAGFESQGPVLNLLPDDADFLAAFKDCHPTLSLIELARFYQIADDSFCDWAEFFSTYQLRYSERLVQLLPLLPQTPESFQTWAAERSLSLKDFAIFYDFKTNLEALVPYLEKVVELRMSKTQGVSALEWAGELHLMDLPSATILAESKSAEAWMIALKKMRYPSTSQADGAEDQKLKEVSWPRHSQVSGRRQGDHYQVDVKISSPSPEDLIKKSESLRRAAEQWRDLQSPSSPPQNAPAGHLQ